MKNLLLALVAVLMAHSATAQEKYPTADPRSIDPYYPNSPYKPNIF